MKLKWICLGSNAWKVLEEARFRAALNPNPIEIEPKNVSYEDAKRDLMNMIIM